jgi:hypothetical protein
VDRRHRHRNRQRRSTAEHHPTRTPDRALSSHLPAPATPTPPATTRLGLADLTVPLGMWPSVSADAAAVSERRSRHADRNRGSPRLADFQPNRLLFRQDAVASRIPSTRLAGCTQTAPAAGRPPRGSVPRCFSLPPPPRAASSRQRRWSWARSRAPALPPSTTPPRAARYRPTAGGPENPSASAAAPTHCGARSARLEVGRSSVPRRRGHFARRITQQAR